MYSQENITKTDELIDFSIDVTNCKQLTIKVGVAVYWSNSYQFLLPGLSYMAV